MIDGNISMEEDTELHDLVVQTLENNGVLAKVRAELRASVFLALEEQESVMNPEPLLNKTVKQYLSNSEGKLLFSLVREFLEYFGLDYTISVYDPETYCGKEYNYVGRNKLQEELGIKSDEPLLGQILKSGINNTFNHLQKDKTNETSSNNLNNATFDISVPTTTHDSQSDSSQSFKNKVPLTPNQDQTINNQQQSQDDSKISDSFGSFQQDKDLEKNAKETTNQNCTNNIIDITNRKSTTNTNRYGKTVYFEQIIIGGKKENPLMAVNQTDPEVVKNLPPLNGKTANINDLKELMHTGLATDGIDNYDEEFSSSASGTSMNGQQSPDDKIMKNQQPQDENINSGEMSEDIEEIDELLSSTSCLDDNFTTTGITTDCLEKV